MQIRPIVRSYGTPYRTTAATYIRVRAVVWDAARDRQTHRHLDGRDQCTFSPRLRLSRNVNITLAKFLVSFATEIHCPLPKQNCRNHFTRLINRTSMGVNVTGNYVNVLAKSRCKLCIYPAGIAVASRRCLRFPSMRNCRFTAQ